MTWMASMSPSLAIYFSSFKNEGMDFLAAEKGGANVPGSPHPLLDAAPKVGITNIQLPPGEGRNICYQLTQGELVVDMDIMPESS